MLGLLQRAHLEHSGRCIVDIVGPGVLVQPETPADPYTIVSTKHASLL